MKKITKHKNAGMLTKGLIMAVMILVVTIALIAIPRMIGEAAEKAGESVACEKSLEINEGLRILGGSLTDSIGSAVAINCVTEYAETSKKGEELTEEFAGHIHDCWKLYGGREKLFNQETGTYCIICKSIEVKETDRFEEGLVDFLKNKEPIIKRGTYLARLGGESVLDAGADSRYNFYSFNTRNSTALVVTFGTIGFTGNHLLYNTRTGIGMLLHPYDRVGELGCYSFEGKTTSLQYKR